MSTAARKAAVKKAAPKKAVKRAAPKKAVKRAAPKKAAKKCYFTTACTQYYGLPDNCTQLNTLRNFRDTVLAQTEEGRKLIKLYYKVAPGIVTRIEQSNAAAAEFTLIFNHVNECCRLIWEKQNNRAKNLYIKMVNYLIKKYQ